jgi:hypothetical protein
MGLKMPDITQAQILAAIQWVIAQLVSWTWINNDTGQIVISASSSFVSFAWIVADAFLRGKRNEHAAALAFARGSATLTQ